MMLLILGPSPRVWGIRLLWRNSVLCFRSIPTRVGNTLNILLFSLSISVHPHACGEYAYAIFTKFFDTGPSPRVWGILLVRVFLVLALWSIPTRVGNTLSQG